MSFRRWLWIAADTFRAALDGSVRVLPDRGAIVDLAGTEGVDLAGTGPRVDRSSNIF